jgi:hypothetical protein
MPEFVFRVHAIQRMFARGIDEDVVKDVVRSGEVIREYPDDTPYPSRLVLGWKGHRPIHVVVAYNVHDDQEIVITAYEPDAAIWKPDFKRKRDDR